MPKKKKPYYPNNWQAFKDAPDDMFMNHTFDELMDWKVAGWELPSSVNCIIRTMDVNTKKVKEYHYKRPGAARNKVKKLMDEGRHEFTLVDADSIHHLSPRYDDDETEED